MTSTRISGLIITFNEQRHIRDCIQSLRQVCDDIVVVDSCSTDDTVAIAQAEGATVIIQKFLGDGPQRTAGLPYCKHDWVLNLDADERLENDLAEWLLANDLATLGVDAIETRRRNFVGNQTTRFAGQYPDYICRIFNSKKAGFSPVVAHSRVQAAAIQRIACHITHYSYRDYPDILNRACKYAVWTAEELAKSGKSIYPLAPFSHGFFSFFKHYVVKLGFLAGLDGLTLSIGKGLASYLKYAHAISLIRKK